MEKQQNPQVIDYEKLADAIVKANRKENEKYSVCKEWMKYWICFMFISIAIISVGIAISLFCEILPLVYTVCQVFDLNLYVVLTIKFIGALFFLSISLISIFSIKEITNENDKQNIYALFSNVVAFVALFVSLIALLKGVL